MNCPEHHVARWQMVTKMQAQNLSDTAEEATKKDPW